MLAKVVEGGKVGVFARVVGRKGCGLYWGSLGLYWSNWGLG